jgi:putative endonuclease
MDLSKRLLQHETGVDPSTYTYSRRPVKLVWCEELNTRKDAFALERQIKGWNRKKKEALIRHDFGAIHEIVHEEWVRREKRKHDPEA